MRVNVNTWKAAGFTAGDVFLVDYETAQVPCILTRLGLSQNLWYVLISLSDGRPMGEATPTTGGHCCSPATLTRLAGGNTWHHVQDPECDLRGRAEVPPC